MAQECQLSTESDLLLKSFTKKWNGDIVFQHQNCSLPSSSEEKELCKQGNIKWFHAHCFEQQVSNKKRETSEMLQVYHNAERSKSEIARMLNDWRIHMFVQNYYQDLVAIKVGIAYTCLPTPDAAAADVVHKTTMSQEESEVYYRLPFSATFKPYSYPIVSNLIDVEAVLNPILHTVLRVNVEYQGNRHSQLDDPGVSDVRKHLAPAISSVEAALKKLKSASGLKARVVCRKDYTERWSSFSQVAQMIRFSDSTRIHYDSDNLDRFGKLDHSTNEELDHKEPDADTDDSEQSVRMFDFDIFINLELGDTNTHAVDSYQMGNSMNQLQYDLGQLITERELVTNNSGQGGGGGGGGGGELGRFEDQVNEIKTAFTSTIKEYLRAKVSSRVFAQVKLDWRDAPLQYDASCGVNQSGCILYSNMGRRMSKSSFANSLRPQYVLGDNGRGALLQVCNFDHTWNETFIPLRLSRIVNHPDFVSNVKRDVPFSCNPKWLAHTRKYYGVELVVVPNTTNVLIS